MKKTRTEERVLTDENKNACNTTMTELRAPDEQFGRESEVRKPTFHKPDDEPVWQQQGAGKVQDV